MLEQIPRRRGVHFRGICTTLKGGERAVRSREAGFGVDEIAMVIASEAHNKANVDMGREENMRLLEQMTRAAIDSGHEVFGWVLTSFGCPITGDVPVRDALRIGKWWKDIGATYVGFGDTTGAANPRQVSAFYENVLSHGMTPDEVVVHFHDTRGCGLANSLVALGFGLRYFDGSLGAIGGQPKTGAAQYTAGTPGTPAPRTWWGCSRRWASAPGSTWRSSSISGGRRSRSSGAPCAATSSTPARSPPGHRLRQATGDRRHAGPGPAWAARPAVAIESPAARLAAAEVACSGEDGARPGPGALRARVPAELMNARMASGERLCDRASAELDDAEKALAGLDVERAEQRLVAAKEALANPDIAVYPEADSVQDRYRELEARIAPARAERERRAIGGRVEARRAVISKSVTAFRKALAELDRRAGDRAALGAVRDAGRKVRDDADWERELQDKDADFKAYCDSVKQDADAAQADLELAERAADFAEGPAREHDAAFAQAEKAQGEKALDVRLALYRDAGDRFRRCGQEAEKLLAAAPGLERLALSLSAKPIAPAAIAKACKAEAPRMKKAAAVQKALDLQARKAARAAAKQQRGNKRSSRLSPAAFPRPGRTHFHCGEPHTGGSMAANLGAQGPKAPAGSRYNLSGGAGARVAHVVLGVWLFISAFVWSHTYASRTNTWICGLLAVAFAVWALWAPAAVANTALLIRLLLGAVVFHANAATPWNNISVAHPDLRLLARPQHRDDAAGGEVRRGRDRACSRSR